MLTSNRLVDLRIFHLQDCDTNLVLFALIGEHTAGGLARDGHGYICFASGFVDDVCYSHGRFSFCQSVNPAVGPNFVGFGGAGGLEWRIRFERGQGGGCGVFIGLAVDAVN